MSYQNSPNGQLLLKRVSNVGATPTSTTLSLPINNITPSVFRLGYQPNTLFVGDYSGLLFKATQMDQPNPTATQINTSMLAQSYSQGTIMCIELGASDDEILLTTTNYGQKSVWLTRDGGQTWTSKDEQGFGLPDIPVRYALFNPKDRRQVMLATELGVWFTNNVYAPNPGWAPANTGLANVRCDMLHYRNADGQVALGTHGREILPPTFSLNPSPMRSWWYP